MTDLNPDATSLFAARPAADGTDTVVITVDSRTALQLAAAWDHTHVSIDTNAIAHPLWWWDVAALRRAAADASVSADAAAQRVPFAPTPKAKAHLRLVEVVEAVKTS